MDRHYIESHDIIARYVRDQLSDEDTDAFEVFMLENPSVAEETNIELALHQSLQKNAELLEHEQRGNSSPEPIGNITRLSPKPTIWQRPAFAQAASLFAAIGLIGTASLYSQNQTLQRDIAAANLSEPASVAAQVWIERTRGSDIPSIDVPDTGTVIVQLDAGPIDAGQYNIFIKRPGTNEAWTITKVASDQNNLIPLTLPAQPKGRYQIEIQPTDGDSDPIEYVFEFI